MFKCARYISVFVFATLFVRAELPTARLQSIFPMGGRIGTTLEVTAEGTDLDDATKLQFSVAGISGERKATNWNSASANFTVTISTNVPQGVYEARVLGRFGISNPRFFAVGNLAETNAASTNHTLASAMSIAEQLTVNAFATAAAAAYFKFDVKKSDRVLIECTGAPCDSKMEPVLTLLDSAGREQARARRDHLLDFQAADSGTYIVKVQDVAFRGGKQFPYRLTVSTNAHIDFIEPLAVIPGTTNQIQVFGRNLPGGNLVKATIDGRPLEKVSIDLPAATTTNRSTVQSIASAPVASFDVRLFDSAVPVSVATAPIVREHETSEPQQVTVPCEIQGSFCSFNSENDVDAYEFASKKGDVLWFEVFSQRLGKPTDPFLLLQKVTKSDKGEIKLADVQEMYDADANVGGIAFNSSTRDPAGRLEVKEDGTYRLSIRDLFHHTPDPSRTYRLSIRRENPDFALVALVDALPTFEKDKREVHVWSSFLRRNDSIIVKVIALRRDNFNGAIALTVAGLPAETRASESVIREGQNSAWLSISAGEKTADWRGGIQIIGKANAGTNELVRTARAATPTWEVPDYNNEPAESRLVQDLEIAVGTEATPVRVEPGELIFQGSTAANVQIPIKLVRSSDFKEVVKLRAFVDSQDNPVKEWDADAAAAETKFDLDIKAAKLAPGPHQLYVLANTKGKMRRVRPEEVAGFETAKAAADAEQKRADAKPEQKAAATALFKELDERLKVRDVAAIFTSPVFKLIVNAPPTAAK